MFLLYRMIQFIRCREETMEKLRVYYHRKLSGLNYNTKSGN